MNNSDIPSYNRFDVIVVGAGHAGCEAAAAAARMNCRTLLLTISLDTIAQLSCNPAIGGIAKGQVVKEVDALGGLMGLVTDRTAIQFRLLNRGKGPAVRSPRAQCDREQYRVEMRKQLERVDNLDIRQGTAVDLYLDDGSVAGVITSTGTIYKASSVVLTTGTFLDGKIHIGSLQFAGGRTGEPAAIGLTKSCEKLGLTAGRLKTGTPPRLWADGIAFNRLQEQPGDDEPAFFSFRTIDTHLPQRYCYIARTTDRTHEILRSSFDRTPLFTGQIRSEGPRYCPSIELKLVRFSDKASHLLFLEPEGLNNDEYYLNGFATSVPEEVQWEAVRTVEGLEKVRLSRPGYAIEYDYFEPLHLRPTLESRTVPNLFFAGQINGTSGYEEAAGQGMVAGINAALNARGSKEEFSLDRAEAYIGVMIDDLITKGAGEPYRLFTSRAEHRLILRTDNVYSRLMKYGKRFGLISDAEYTSQERIWNEAREIMELLSERFFEGSTLLQRLRRPETDIESVIEMHPKLRGETFIREVLEMVQTEAKYSGYVERQREEIERFRRSEELSLPADVDYFAIEEIRFESREKLSAVMPTSIGQASRIPGVTPADISILLVKRKSGNLPREGGSEK